MAGTLKKLKKLRGRSLDELRARTAQTLAACAERRGLSAQSRLPHDASFFRMIDAEVISRLPVSAQSLLEHFRTRTSPHFFAAFDDREETISELCRRWPHVEEVLTTRARRIMEGKFDLLGLKGLNFGEPVDWHLEPLAGKRAPRTHWSRIDYLNPDVAGDKKIIWELNRHQHFMVLGRAYWLTRDERYAQVFVTHLDSWMQQNPPKMGINWASSLEVAFRSISWLWALYFFKDSPHLSPAIFLRALKFLYLHVRHLETYLSTYFSPNTHLTGEALGLFYLGTLLPEFSCAERWRATGSRILFAELERHVRADGVYFEQSSYYHRYTADFYTHLLILARLNNQPIERVLEEKLTGLLDHLMYITRPDGTTPFFGDDDGGRLVMLDERGSSDFRATLSTGAALFARPDYKYVAGEAAEETLWLLGARALKAFDDVATQPPGQTSRAFKDGGYYVMRDGWTRAANYLLIDCGPHGALKCGHAHADALGLELAARGRTLLVDPGTYTYTGSAVMRDLFRSSAAHNTLTVDNQSSSVPDGPFAWKHVAKAAARRWINHERFDFFEGEHDGYARLSAPATHVRSILFIKDGYWIMRDRVKTEGTHRYDLHFHFASGADPVLETHDPAVRERQAEAAGLEIFTFAEDGEWRREEGWVSSCYGQRALAPVCLFSGNGTGAQEFTSFLIPRRAEQGAARVREIEAVGGRAFELHDGESRDVLLAGDGALVESIRFASDFEWAWARFTDDNAVVPEELVLINGHRFCFDGQEILDSAERLCYAFARRIGDELRVETDAKVFNLRLPVGDLKYEISDV